MKSVVTPLFTQADDDGAERHLKNPLLPFEDTLMNLILIIILTQTSRQKA